MSRCAPAAAVLLGVGLVTGACGEAFEPDRDALHAKISGECNVFPRAPACVDPGRLDDPVSLHAWEIEFFSAVDSEREQSCILDVDCSGDRSGVGPAILACLTLEQQFRFPWQASGPPSDPACLNECASRPQEDECANPEATCTVALVDLCKASLEACLDDCG